MLTRTSETALQALLYLIKRGADAPVPPAEIARELGASPSYMSKIATLLVKADVLRAHRGVHGGVTLARQRSEIALLEVVEACQGRILGDYCQEFDRPELVCAFHRAMLELHTAIVEILRRWTLEDLAAKPGPSRELEGMVNCRMQCAGAMARAK